MRGMLNMAKFASPLFDVRMLPYRVLIVNDAPIISLGLDRQLRRWGFQHITIVTSGQAALRAAAHQHPDLVVMAANLPGIPGSLETARRLQQATPVDFLLLQNADDEDAQTMSPYRLVPNPPTVAELRAGVAEYLHQGVPV